MKNAFSFYTDFHQGSSVIKVEVFFMKYNLA